MKTVLVLSLLAGLNAGAETLTCYPTQPCDHVYELNKCVSSFVIKSEAKKSSVQVNYRHENISFEVLFVPDFFPITLSKTATTLSFQDETGDQNGQLTLAADGKISGHITLEQDFPFAVTCAKKVDTAEIEKAMKKGKTKATEISMDQIPKNVRQEINKVDVAFEMGDGYYDVQSEKIYAHSLNGQVVGYELISNLSYTEGDDEVAQTLFLANGERFSGPIHY